MTLRLLFTALLAGASLLLNQPATAAPARDFERRADALLEQHLAAGDFSGVVIVAVRGRPLLRRAYGLADREWNIPITLDTVFRIGSTTKTFTAAAILQLVEAGKVRLDDPISRYVPNLPATWSSIPLRQLLNHTSGIPDYVQVNGFIRGPVRLEQTPEQIIGLVRDQPLDFAPGTKFNYSNTGYVLLGMVIERVSGQRYADYLREHLWRPIGLNHTAYDDLGEVLPRRASGYWISDGTLKNARPWTASAAYSTGGLRTTADDLLRWDQALHTGKVLGPASMSAMFADYGHGYGFGSFVETREGHRLWDHGGNITGFSVAFEYYPDDGLSVIVLTNIEGKGSERLAKDLASIYFGWTH